MSEPRNPSYSRLPGSSKESGPAQTSPQRPDTALSGDEQLMIQALRSACEEARAASRAKTEFLASVSHELRTPLNAIVGFAEIISREQLGAIEEKRYAAYAKDIMNSARRLQNILSDILDMARLESGRVRVQRSTLALSDVVEEALVLVADRAPPRAPAHPARRPVRGRASRRAARPPHPGAPLRSRPENGLRRCRRIPRAAGAAPRDARTRRARHRGRRPASECTCRSSTRP